MVAIVRSVDSLQKFPCLFLSFADVQVESHCRVACSAAGFDRHLVKRWICSSQSQSQNGIGKRLDWLHALAAELGADFTPGASSSVALVEAFQEVQETTYQTQPRFRAKPSLTAAFLRRTRLPACPGMQRVPRSSFLVPQVCQPSTPTIDAFSAGFWLGSGALNYGTGQDPKTQSYNVSSHSYIINPFPEFGTDEAEELLQRLDYYIDRSDSLVVAGSSNHLDDDDLAAWTCNLH